MGESRRPPWCSRWVDWGLALGGIGVASWQVGTALWSAAPLPPEHLGWLWMGAAVPASAGALLCYGWLHERLLSCGGVTVRPLLVQAVTVAGNAVSLTIPAAGAAAGPAYTVRALRQRGVPTAESLWAVVVAGALSVAILVVAAPSILALAGVLDVPLALSATALLAVSGAVTWWLLRRPGTVAWGVRWETAMARWVHRGTLGSADVGTVQAMAWLGRHRPGPVQWAELSAVAALTWMLDYASLAGCLAVTGTGPLPWDNLALGYLVVQASILLHLTPAGTGPAEAGLLATLGSGGVAPSTAALTVLLYRGVSWLLPAFVGWLVVLGLARTRPS